MLKGGSEHGFAKEKCSDSIKIWSHKVFERKTRRFSSSNGYRSAIFISKNSQPFYYFEAQIVSDNGNARIGIATDQAEINGPIGIDTFGYSIGSKNGYLFHEGKRTLFGERFYKDDIISCLFFTEPKKLIFYVNGEKIKSEITNIKDGVYWPACSSFKKSVVEVCLNNYFTYRSKIFKEFGMEEC